MMDKDAQSVTQELKACPFCNGEMMARHALWPSDGDRDAIIHKEPTTCGLVCFSIDTADEGVSVATAWNTRLASQPTSAEDAVAVIGKDWRLLWADQGPLSEIVGRTGIKIGSRLYATPDTQTAAIGAEDAAEKWLDGYSVPEHRNDQDYSSDQMVDAFMAGGREARGVALSFATGLDDADFANVAFALNQRMCCDGHMCGCQGATVGQYLAHELRASLSQPVAAPQAEDADANCERCQGNGEIVTDWKRYLHAHDGDVGDEAVADCPDCDGTGHVDLSTPPQPEGGALALDRLIAIIQHEANNGAPTPQDYGDAEQIARAVLAALTPEKSK